MVRQYLFPGKGTNSYVAGLDLSIRLTRKGCTNRPFFHIIVQEKRRVHYDEAVEQLGCYDPMANDRNEKLIALNFERVLHWIGKGAELTRPVQELLGLTGLLPIHPRTYMTAWRQRIQLEQAKLESQEKLQQQQQQSSDSN